MIVTCGLLALWLFFIAFGVIAATDPLWLRKLSGIGKEVETNNVKNRADAIFRRGNPREAIELYKYVLDIRPDFTGASVNLAIAYGRTGQPAYGEKILLDALESGTERPGIIAYNLGEILEKQGKFEEAIQNYNKAIDTSVGQDRVYGKLGAIYLQQNLLDKARESFQKRLQIQLDPCTSYRYMLRRCLTTHKRFPEAIQAAQEHLDRGVVTDDLEPFDLEIITQLQRVDRGISETCTQLGIIYRKLGENSLADKYLNQALMIWPENPTARAALSPSAN
ncbi:MAG: tetratricopeptide repeat protein [Candidatus Eisenbacteria bacterium]|nr:tetratricopeptide repeat protein [Candidatus Eisenbacteria bacterium]MBU1949214.1 tetratricopeptide repeat protein [Candidatus Eisenbacteria bacterium]